MNVLEHHPGGTSGFATWVDDVWFAWATVADETPEVVQDHLARGAYDLFVCESFIITAGTLKKGRDGARAIELIGASRYLAKCYDVPFETQSPSDAKMFATDEKLRKMGWWTKGLDHPRDASRHLLLALSRHRAVDLRILL